MSISTPDSKKEDTAACFQDAVVDVLVNKSIGAARSKGIKRIVLSGGVSANTALRERIKKESLGNGIDVYLPSLQLCTDNAAMVAAAGYHRFLKGEFADISLNPKAYLPLGA